MLLTLLTIADNSGECDLDRLVDDYTAFYRHRLDAGWQVDKSNCPYQHPEKLEKSEEMLIVSDLCEKIRAGLN